MADVGVGMFQFCTLDRVSFGGGGYLGGTGREWEGVGGSGREWEGVGGSGRRFVAGKLATQLLPEGCYGAERTFVRLKRNPPFMCLQFTCALSGVEQGHVNLV